MKVVLEQYEDDNEEQQIQKQNTLSQPQRQTTPEPEESITKSYENSKTIPRHVHYGKTARIASSKGTSVSIATVPSLKSINNSVGSDRTLTIRTGNTSNPPSRRVTETQTRTHVPGQSGQVGDVDVDNENSDNGLDCFDFVKGIGMMFLSIMYCFDGLFCIYFNRQSICFYSRITDGHEAQTQTLGFCLLKAITMFQVLYFVIFWIIIAILPEMTQFVAFITILTILVSFSTIGQLYLMRSGWRQAGPTSLVLLLLMLIKIAHTIYFMNDLTVQLIALDSSENNSDDIGSDGSDKSDEEDSFTIQIVIFVTMALFETFLVFQLILSMYLLFPHSKYYLVLWSFEYTDILSSIATCICFILDSESKQMNDWSDSLTAYFIFMLLKIFLYCLPLPIVLGYQDSEITMSNDKPKVYAAYHVAFIDVITDLPMVCKQYVFIVCGISYILHILYILYFVIPHPFFLF